MTFPTGVSQKTWSTSASEVITASLLRANVTDPVWLLTSPPMAVLAQTVTPTSVGSGSATTVGMDTEILDTTNGHADVGNIQRWYAAVAGWYLIRGVVAFSAGTSNQADGFYATAHIFTQSTSTTVDQDLNIANSLASQLVACGGCELAVLNAPSTTVTSNDYVWLSAFQDTGSTVQTHTTLPGVSQLMIRWAGTVTGTTGLPVPANPGYSDTTEITGTFLNTNMRDAVRFLTFPPMARLTQTSAQSVPSQTFPAGTAVTFGATSAPGTSNSSDNYSGWSSSNPTRYTFPVAGRYWVYGQIPYHPALGNAWAAGLRVNGGTTTWGNRFGAPTTTSPGQMPVVEQWIRANAGDYVELMASQNSGSSSTLVVTSETVPKMIVLWEGS